MMDSIRGKLSLIKVPDVLYASGIRPVRTDFYSTDITRREVRPNAHEDFVREYGLVAELFMRFHCTDAQLDEARVHAEKMVMLNLYGGFLDSLGRLRAAIYAGDQKQCVLIMDGIQSEISA